MKLLDNKNLLDTIWVAITKQIETNISNCVDVYCYSFVVNNLKWGVYDSTINSFYSSTKDTL